MPQGNVRRRLSRTMLDFLRVLALCVPAAVLLTGASGPGGGGGGGGRDETTVTPSFPGVSLKVLNAISPPGGSIQFLVTLTEPKPIATGMALMSTDTTLLGPVMGAALFGPNGSASDAAGAVVVNGGSISVRATSPSGQFGTQLGSPILALTMAVRPDAPVGARSVLAIDPASSWWLDPNGQSYPEEVTNGNFEVGGTLSISGVYPGGGVVPAGTPVTIRGKGFQPGALVEADDVAVATTNVVDSTRIDVTFAVDADLYGRRVRVRNPNRERAAYYPYLRTSWLGQSARPLLARTDPVFSPQTYTGAFVSKAVGANQFLALALQNPGDSPADVSVELRSSSGGSIATTTVTMPSDTRIAREVSELFGRSPPADGYLVVRSNSPVQVLGLLGDDVAGTVEPVIATLAFP
jgi:hypothetical protein